MNEVISEVTSYKIQAEIDGEWMTFGIGQTMEFARKFVMKFPQLNIANAEHRIVKVFKKEEVVE